MIITHTEIDWMLKFGNAPSLSISAIDVPAFNHDDPIWTMQPNGIVHAQRDGVVRYLYMAHGIVPQESARGYGGRTFAIRLTNGCTVISNDCWSSNSRNVDIPCVDVVINGSQAAITTQLFHKLIYKLGAYVVPPGDHRPFYTISCEQDRIAKPRPLESYA